MSLWQKILIAGLCLYAVVSGQGKYERLRAAIQASEPTESNLIGGDTRYWTMWFGSYRYILTALPVEGFPRVVCIGRIAPRPVDKAMAFRREASGLDERPNRLPLHHLLRSLWERSSDLRDLHTVSEIIDPPIKDMMAPEVAKLTIPESPGVVALRTALSIYATQRWAIERLFDDRARRPRHNGPFLLGPRSPGWHKMKETEWFRSMEQLGARKIVRIKVSHTSGVGPRWKLNLLKATFEGTDDDGGGDDDGDEYLGGGEAEQGHAEGESARQEVGPPLWFDELYEKATGPRRQRIHKKGKPTRGREPGPDAS